MKFITHIPERRLSLTGTGHVANRAYLADFS